MSVTNGDIGHHQMAGAILARRRTAEVKRCAEILGIETEVLDIHDGELMPTLENRRTITRKIREWQADVVISPRPNDWGGGEGGGGVGGGGGGRKLSRHDLRQELLAIFPFFKQTIERK